jgi:hypothetical protein
MARSVRQRRPAGGTWRLGVSRRRADLITRLLDPHARVRGMRRRVMTLLVAIAVGGLPGASAQDDARDPYSAIIDQYRSDPERAIEQATALSPAAFTGSRGTGIPDASGTVSEHLQAAMLMHRAARSRAGTAQPADRLQRRSRYGELASGPRRSRPRQARRHRRLWRDRRQRSAIGATGLVSPIRPQRQRDRLAPHRGTPDEQKRRGHGTTWVRPWRAVSRRVVAGRQ